MCLSGSTSSFLPITKHSNYSDEYLSICMFSWKYVVWYAWIWETGTTSWCVWIGEDSRGRRKPPKECCHGNPKYSVPLVKEGVGECCRISQTSRGTHASYGWPAFYYLFNYSLLVFILDRVLCRPSWPHIHRAAEDDFELPMILLPYLESAKITSII